MEKNTIFLALKYPFKRHNFFFIFMHVYFLSDFWVEKLGPFLLHLSGPKLSSVLGLNNA